jgi:general secretion pathway protein E
LPDEPASVAALVRREGLLGPEALARAELVQEETGERLEAVLTRLGLVSEQALAEAFSAVTGLAILAVADLPPAPVAATVLSPSFLRDALALPIALCSESITVAMANPLDSYAVRAIGFAAGQPAQPAPRGQQVLRARPERRVPPARRVQLGPLATGRRLRRFAPSRARPTRRHPPMLAIWSCSRPGQR